MSINKKLLGTVFLLALINNFSFAQEQSNPNSHYTGKLAVGFNLGIGYNVINHVDGTLAVIPNKPSPEPSPGTPVYSSLTSINIDAPFLSVEYWALPSVSVKLETGANIIVVGADHALADFAYILSYWKFNIGSRFYFAPVGIDSLFIGAGWFVGVPIAKPLIGFIEANTKANVSTGPYVELGMNYPVNKILSIEVFGRFYFSLGKLTEKNDPNILVDMAISPFDLGFGFNWAIL